MPVVLTTTRAVRKRIDLGRAVPLEPIAECIEAARRGRTPQQQRKGVVDSEQYLADHSHEVPIHVIPCIKVWSETPSPAMPAALFGSSLPRAGLAGWASGMGSAAS